MVTASWRPALIALDLLLLAMIAFFAARVANAVLAARWAGPPPRAAAAPPPPAPPAAVEPATAYAVIAERDVFNAVKHPGGAAASGAASDAFTRTDLNLKLWGTALAHDPARSYAIIEDQAARRQALYRVGDTVLEVATLVRVEWDRVILGRDGNEEVLEISSARASGKDAVPAGGTSGAAGERIRKTADNKFLIDRRELEATVANINEVFTQARAVPFFENGKTVGFRVFAIKPGSVFEKIGLQNGDVINRVNGVELTDPTKAITLFTELQNEGHIAVDLQRNKQAKNFSYEIR
ncbi:MAG: type II secretion system protein GspC [Deltaproteobacteria bacterium]|nr:type II secretion system protein GspC [Deltaproteobacteria bacterium]